MLLNDIEKIAGSVNKNTEKESKVPIVDTTNYNNIVHTNHKYQKKLKNGLGESCDKTSFEKFIDNDMDNIRYLNWNQIPISYKHMYLRNYIKTDNSLEPEEKILLLEKITLSNTNTPGIVKYSKKNGLISKMNYDVLT